MFYISRFLVLVIINLPIVLIGIIGAITSYKTSRTSKKRCITEVTGWIIVGISLVLIQPVYNLLVQNHLTASDSMSIFDVILLTLILLCGLLIIRANEKIALLNKKLSRIHEHIAIKEAEYDTKIEG
jgi:hypothetical protein